ncbi:MAG: DUF927 domain-containing protein [Mesorhizobium sp.]
MSKDIFPWKIGKAIRAKNGSAYFRVDGPSGKLWRSSAELASGGGDLMSSISAETGATMLSQSKLAVLRKLAEDYGPFEEGIVAATSGWCGDNFVFGNGDVCPAPGGKGVDVVTLTTNEKFIPRGGLRKWQKRMAPFISGQPLPFFACALALCGPLYRFFDSSVGVVQAELIGEAGSGKSTLGTLAASVWAGNPERSEGGGESWNMTLNAYDIVRVSHRNTFLLLDEAEGSGRPLRERADFAKAVIFKGSQSRMRRRFTDTTEAPDVHTPVLSTSNTPLTEVLRRDNEQAKNAALQRMMSLRIVRSPSADGMTVFESLPKGHEKMSDVVRDLRSSVDKVYGSPGRSFVEKLVRLAASDEEALRKRLQRGIEHARGRLFRIDEFGEDRHRSMLAAVEVAASLAQEFGILNPDWGTPAAVVDFVYRECTATSKRHGQTGETAYRRFIEYLCSQAAAGKLRPLKKGQVGSNPPFHPILICETESGGTAYLSPGHFEATFPGAHSFLVEMKKLGRLVLHDSERDDRLQVHAPTKIGCYGFKRVYAIKMEKDELKPIGRSLNERKRRIENSTSKTSPRCSS